MPSYSFKWSTPDADDASIVVRNGAGTIVATGTTADVVAVTNEAFVTYTVDLPAGDTYTATATVLGRSRSTVGVPDTSAAGLSATFAGRSKVTTPLSLTGVTRNTPGSPAPYIIGTDASRIFYRGLQSGGIGQSVDGATWSASKGMPADVVWSNCYAMVTFKGNHYLLAMETTGSVTKVFKAAPVAGDGAWTWTGVLTLTTGSAPYSTTLSQDGSYLYVGEYGDPTGGPHIWRSSDGAAFTATWSPGSGRHVHAVEPDPYNPGHVWATAGDNVGNSILRSTDSGATWTVVVASGAWQGVQISFSAGYVFFGGDVGAMAYSVWDRAAGAMRVGSLTVPRMEPVPGGAHNGNTPTAASFFGANSHFGAVDPASGLFYACTNEAGTNVWNGLWVCNGPGVPMQLLAARIQGDNLNGRVFVWGGKVWCGLWNFTTPAVA